MSDAGGLLSHVGNTIPWTVPAYLEQRKLHPGLCRRA